MIDPRFASLESCQPLSTHDYSGVYFLRLGEVVVYVGQSQSVVRRIAAHIGKKPFDSMLIMPVPKEALSSVERYWIRKLQPIWNQSGNDSQTSYRPASTDKRQYRLDPLDPRRISIRGKPFWQVNMGTTIRNGKLYRYRRTFSDLREAQTFSGLKKIERKTHGPKSILMPERLRSEAIEANRRIAPYGITILEAVQRYIQEHEASKPPQPETNRERLMLALIAKGNDLIAKENKNLARRAARKRDSTSAGRNIILTPCLDAKKAPTATATPTRRTRRIPAP
jgi:hypothetical protein